MTKSYKTVEKQGNGKPIAMPLGYQPAVIDDTNPITLITCREEEQLSEEEVYRRHQIAFAELVKKAKTQKLYVELRKYLEVVDSPTRIRLVREHKGLADKIRVCGF